MPRQSEVRLPERREHRPFLVLPENQLAYTAATQLLAPRSRGSMPVVTITGPAGVGKSHLVRQFVRSAYSAGSTVVAHVAASEFAAEWEDAVRKKRMLEFHDAYANVACLACEDLHALRTKPGAQQSLVAVIDALRPQGGRVLLSCRRPPGEVPGLSRRLVDRCHGGVCAAFDIPGRPSCVKLLKQFAAEQQVLLPAEVVDYLAESGPQIPRELLGLVTRLAQLAAQRNATVDLPLAAALLRQEPEQKTGRMAEIAREVARQFGVTLRVLRSQSRNAGNVVPRQAAMFLSREMTGAPYAEIGQYFDGRNHSTVVHACQRFETLLQHDPRVASLVETVRDRLPSPAGCRKPVRPRATRSREAG